MSSIFQQLSVYGPGSARQVERDGPVPVLVLTAAFCGTAGMAMALAALSLWLSTELAKVFQAEWQWNMRRGYYGMERRREEANRAFEEGVAALKRAGETDVSKYTRLVREHLDALRRADEAFERETGRDAQDEALARNGFVRLRGNEGGRRSWESPQSIRWHERRRAKRRSAWGEWARRFAEAVRLGREPPERPSGRRGAPIRKLCARSTNPPPRPEQLLAQWEKAKGRAPAEEKVRLGSMMLDIEAAVDNSLVRNTAGEIVGRRPGVRGWLRDRCPELARHYRVLMDCRRLADDFRRAHGIGDPHPATALLEKEMPKSIPTALRASMEPRRKAARKLLGSKAGRSAAELADALDGMLARSRGRGGTSAGRERAGAGLGRAGA